MKKTFGRILLFYLLTFLPLSLSAKDYKYATVPGDLMQTRIYTLDNGLNLCQSGETAHSDVHCRSHRL